MNEETSELVRQVRRIFLDYIDALIAADRILAPLENEEVIYDGSLWPLEGDDEPSLVLHDSIGAARSCIKTTIGRLSLYVGVGDGEFLALFAENGSRDWDSIVHSLRRSWDFSFGLYEVFNCYSEEYEAQGEYIEWDLDNIDHVVAETRRALEQAGVPWPHEYTKPDGYKTVESLIQRVDGGVR